MYISCFQSRQARLFLIILVFRDAFWGGDWLLIISHAIIFILRFNERCEFAQKLRYQRCMKKYIATALENRFKPHCQLIILLDILTLLSFLRYRFSLKWFIYRYYSRPLFLNILYFRHYSREKMRSTILYVDLIVSRIFVSKRCEKISIAYMFHWLNRICVGV